MTAAPDSPTARFRAARDVLLRHRTDWASAVASFSWPRLTEFNWALDWFDVLARDPDGGDRPALRLIGDGGPKDGSPDVGAPGRDRTLTFRELSHRSDLLATGLRERGVRRGDPLLLMVGNRAEVWETILAAIKLGAVLVPTYTTATPAEIADRLERGRVRHVVAEAALTGRFPAGGGRWGVGVGARVGVGTGVGVGGTVPGWTPYEEIIERAPTGDGTGPAFVPDGPTPAHAPLFRYFTSGTTARPKMVEHTHVSYPVGHLSGMYWNGLLPGDLHLNLSAPGWAKHAWSSFFVPWNAEATVVALDHTRVGPAGVLRVLRTRGVTSFCAPPSLWRTLVAEGLGGPPGALRETVSAGEPLDPALADTVRRHWGVELRDGYGQTETTGQIGNPPGRRPRPGSMGLPLPGYRVTLRSPATGREVPDGEPGEICLELGSHRPLGLMSGYVGAPADATNPVDPPDATDATDPEGPVDPPDPDPEGPVDPAPPAGHHRTGDLAVRAPDGSLTHLARADDMFKSFDHRISPRELEEVLLGHPAVAEAAVVPEPHPEGRWVPKAYVVPAPGRTAGGETARAVLARVRDRLPPEKWVRSLEFLPELPRTASGKIRRAGLRDRATGSAPRVHRLDPGEG
ncbi:AMP-binding protein [Streptomyces sp. NPDC000594]|uniref:AMP-binding protein n=1 Tax=Streptomyces sp. NPDC000594 TaxID=3154261 RepID=UPI0033229D38